MEMSRVVLGFAVVGLLVNLLTLAGIVWRGGRFVGTVETNMGSFANELREIRPELRELRQSRDQHALMLGQHAVLIEQCLQHLRRIAA